MSLRILRNRPRFVVLAGALFMLAPSLPGQRSATSALTLAQALDDARRLSPDLRAAREAVGAATARERQAGAHPNPTLSYGREQTAVPGQKNSQNIAALEQRVELGGIRSARVDAARWRREVATARLTVAEAQVHYETTRAYALAVAADRRATLATQAAESFVQALSVSERRLAAGDVSGYANRRIRLEAARYATVRAEAQLARRTARLTLAALVSNTTDSIGSFNPVLTDSLPTPTIAAASPGVASVGASFGPAPDSLTRLALRWRADLRAVDLEAAAARADAQLATRERVPVPAFSLGFKNERVAGSSDQASGFTAGVSIPLPLWDRRAGAIAASDAESRRRVAEVDGFRRRVVREVAEAYDSYVALEAQVAALAPQLGVETRAAMRSVQIAYSEGEVTLLEWLDAVRAYQEAESSFASLRAEATIRRAALERAVGAPLSLSTTTHDRANAPAKD